MHCCVYNLFLCLMEHSVQSGREHSAKQGNPEVNKILRGEGESSYQRNLGRNECEPVLNYKIQVSLFVPSGHSHSASHF